jgi:DNA polymerase-3 subunit gamma/tau
MGPMSDLDPTLEPPDAAPRDDLTADIFGGSAPQAGPAPPAPAAPYTVFARKYRPRTFEDLIGQQAMVRTLTNAFASGRIAHAFMLTGVRGVGKTTTARLLARALNYESDSVRAPSLAHLATLGRHCQAILEGRHLDVLELDAASRTGIDDIRELTDSVRYAPAQARYKVYILDEIHMLSEKAFNALLKTLEEPPPHAKFIFATTEIRKVPVTILSRCQRFDLRRVEPEVIVANLAAIARAEGLEIEPDALTLIARAAEGSVRDAQSLLDQALVQAEPGVVVGAAAVRDMLGLSDRALTIGLIEVAARGDAGAAITAFRELHALGADPGNVVMDLLEHCHGASIAKALGPEVLRLPKDQAARLTALGASLSAGTLSRLWQMLLKGLDEVRSAPDAAAALDMLLVRVAFAADLPSPEEALRAVRDGAAGSGQAVRSGPSAPGAGQSRAPAGPAPAAPALAVALRAPSTPAGDAPTGPRSFADLAQLAEAQRDIGLKFDIERFVRPISFRPGAIVFEPAPGAPSNLQQRLAARLKAWTGEPWLVAAEHGGGAETLDEIHRQALARAHGEVLAEPFVQALFDAFPGAQVVEIRQRAAADLSVAQAEPTEED